MKLPKRILFLVIMAIIAFLLIIGANLLVRGKNAEDCQAKVDKYTVYAESLGK